MRETFAGWIAVVLLLVSPMSLAQHKSVAKVVGGTLSEARIAARFAIVQPTTKARAPKRIYRRSATRPLASGRAGAGSLAFGCMSENPEAFCGGGEGVPTETRSLDYDSWGYYGESGGYFQADVEFIAVDGFELDCSVDACIPIIGRRFPVTQTVCVNGLCREYAEVLIEDLMQIDELRESAAGGWVEEIIDFFFPATVKVKVCSDPRAAAYRHVTKDDGPLVRAVWARSLRGRSRAAS
jgi:hypothetical protein